MLCAYDNGTSRVTLQDLAPKFLIYIMQLITVYVGKLCGVQGCSSEGSHYYNPCKAPWPELEENLTKA